MLNIETSIEGDSWPGSEWQRLSDEAVRAAILGSPHAHLAEGRMNTEISVRFSTDAEVHDLNRRFRGKDKPTNVLSFPAVQPDLLPAMTNSDDGEVLLGDIILAAETCAREAKEKGVALDVHARHLVVHGTLHLVGYDHQNEADAVDMERLETAILAGMGIADPYADTSIGAVADERAAD